MWLANSKLAHRQSRATTVAPQIDRRVATTPATLSTQRPSASPGERFESRSDAPRRLFETIEDF